MPGDVLLVVREGERVAADARVFEANASLEMDESALTGESLPVGKRLRSRCRGKRRSLSGRPWFSAGTGVTRGRVTALVTATGASTELGSVERLSAMTKPPPTPLQQRLARLAREMVVVGVCW